MAKLGIVGRPNSGKTTLFNALCGLDAPVAAHPFSTTEVNLGVAKIPDEWLERGAEVESSAKIVHATLELMEVPQVPGSKELSPDALGKLREMDAMMVVLRAFEDAAAPASESGTDPAAQAEELLLELALADVDVFTKRSERAAKEATADVAMKPQADAFTQASQLLADGSPLRAEQWSPAQRDFFRDLAPLSLKPAVWVINAGEDEATEELEERVAAVVPDGDAVVSLSARIEHEASQLDPKEREELFEGLGLGKGALSKMVRAAYLALDLTTFYTIGPKEAHAWSVKSGSTAPQAAGKIHSDLERGFIRAEVAAIAEVVEAGGWDAAKAAGLVRLEGKDYVVAEGDVIEVRFSV